MRHERPQQPQFTFAAGALLLFADHCDGGKASWRSQKYPTHSVMPVPGAIELLVREAFQHLLFRPNIMACAHKAFLEFRHAHSPAVRSGIALRIERLLGLRHAVTADEPIFIQFGVADKQGSSDSLGGCNEGVQDTLPSRGLLDGFVDQTDNINRTLHCTPLLRVRTPSLKARRSKPLERNNPFGGRQSTTISLDC